MATEVGCLVIVVVEQECWWWKKKVDWSVTRTRGGFYSQVLVWTGSIVESVGGEGVM